MKKVVNSAKLVASDNALMLFALIHQLHHYHHILMASIFSSHSLKTSFFTIPCN